MRQAKVRYYIGKKQYIPDESVLLCVTERDLSNILAQKLYRTQKGIYFIVSESQESETKVRLVNEEKAFSFMDEHTSCIDIGNYNRVFGEPEKG